jgi:hypothetical protein
MSANKVAAFLKRDLAEIRRPTIHPRRRSRKGRDDGFGIRESPRGHRSGIEDVRRVGRESYIRLLFASDRTWQIRARLRRIGPPKQS